MAEYKHGEMDVADHEKTFIGFVHVVRIVAIVCILILIFMAVFNH